MAHLSQLQKTQSYLEKGVFDYTYALQRCYDTGALYIGMFEDDIILADGWFIRTLRGLAGIPGSTQDWLFMRLFNQERSIGWGSHEIGGNNEHWIILGVGIESARKTTKNEAQAIWSMAFEDLDAKALKEEHQKLVSQYQLWRNEILARGED
ncbi:hypothetical protein ACHAP5_009391 [Fusarium lateritium]